MMMVIYLNPILPVFETILSHSQWSVSLLERVLQLSDLLLQTRRLLLVVVELSLQVTPPGLHQSQPLLQLEVNILLISAGLALRVADQ